jgi:hypothetical protein
MSDFVESRISVAGKSLEVVGHRFGNEPLLIEKWQDSTIIELDLRYYRGLIEVRHEKRVPLWGRLWDRWYVLPRSHQPQQLDEVLAQIHMGRHVWLDIKGWSRRVCETAHNESLRRPVTVSSKSWWTLRRIGGHDGARVFQSIGNRYEWFLFRIGWRSRHIDGVVIHQRLLSDRRISMLDHHGLVFTWAITHEQRLQEVARLGVTGVILDEPLFERVIRS